MNKFLDKRVKATADGKRNKKQHDIGAAHEFLRECAACWNALDEARRKMCRSLMYSLAINGAIMSPTLILYLRLLKVTS